MAVIVEAVEKTTFFGSSEAVKYVHSVHFHGRGFRSGREFPSEPAAYLTNSMRDPLSVIRPGNVFPAISRPAGNLVIQSHVMKALEEIEHIQFLPVTLTKVVNWPLAKGDMSYYEQARTRGTDEHEYLKLLPDSRSHFDNVPDLKELLIPKLIDIQNEFGKLERHPFYFGEPGYGSTESFLLSEAMFDKYPVVGMAGITLFRSDVFSRIAHCFDLDFFSRCEREIN